MEMKKSIEALQDYVKGYKVNRYDKVYLDPDEIDENSLAEFIVGHTVAIFKGKDATLIKKIVEGRKERCIIMSDADEITYYVIYKTTRRNVAAGNFKGHSRLAIGLPGEIKKEKVLTPNRIIYNGCENDAMDSFPMWLFGIFSNIDFTQWMGYDGIQDYMRKYVVDLMQSGIYQTAATEIIEIINQYIAIDPLDEEALYDFVNDNSNFPRPKWRYSNDDKKNNGSNDNDLQGKFSHAVVAEWLKQEQRVSYIMGEGRSLYLYDGEIYRGGAEYIKSAVFRLDRKTRDTNREDVVKQLECDDSIEQMTVAPGARYVAVSGGIIDVLAPGRPRLISFDPNIVLLDKINCVYDKNAYDLRTDDFLNEISAGDASIRANLEEVIACCIVPGLARKLEKVAFLIGSGSNGKSTFFDALQALLNRGGEENTKELKMENLTDKFILAMCVGKKLIFSPDITASRLNVEQTSIIKMMVSGDTFGSNKKYRDHTDHRFSAMAIFGCNAMPIFADPSNAITKRLLIIPMNADFTRGNGAEDVKEKLMTESASRYLLKLGIDAARRMLEPINEKGGIRGFTPSTAIQRELEEATLTTDSIKAWLAEKGPVSTFPVWDIIGVPISKLYQDYKSWYIATYNDSDYHKQKNFLENFKTLFRSEAYESKQVRIPGTDKMERVICSAKWDPDKYFVKLRLKSEETYWETVRKNFPDAKTVVWKNKDVA